MGNASHRRHYLLYAPGREESKSVTVRGCMVAWYAASRSEGAGAEKDRSGRVTCCCKGGVAEAAAAPGGAAVCRLSATCVHVSH